MKKQNKIYLSLKEQGIKKAWDKVSIYKSRIDDSLQMVLYWQDKPFAYWYVKDINDIKDLRTNLFSALDYYERLGINSRRGSKYITKYFLKRDAAERVKTFKIGCELYPEIEVF